MPNWCSNSVTIIADTETLNHIKRVGESNTNLTAEAEDREVFSYEAFLSPEEIEHCSGENWYDGRCGIIGSKWFPNLYEFFVPEVVQHYERDREPQWSSSLTFDFDSAWNPTLEGTLKIAEYLDKHSKEDNWGIAHHYVEAGCCFMGIHLFSPHIAGGQYGRQYQPDSIFYAEDGGSALEFIADTYEIPMPIIPQEVRVQVAQKANENPDNTTWALSTEEAMVTDFNRFESTQEMGINFIDCSAVNDLPR